MKTQRNVALGVVLGLLGSVLAMRSSPRFAGWIVPHGPQTALLADESMRTRSLAVMEGEMILVRKPGAVAVIELNDIGSFEAQYRWRSQKPWSADERRGSGSFNQQFEPAPRADGLFREDSTRTTRSISAGPFGLQWSHRSERSSWVHYDADLDVVVLEAVAFNSLPLLEWALP